MPKYLKLIARFANSTLALLCFILAIGSLSGGKPGGFVLGLIFFTLFAFNLYLIEKAASILSEEEWLKSEVRKVLLRRKLRRMAKEDTTGAIPEDSERTD